MSRNYAAWQINYEDFYRQTSPIDQFRFLIRFAVLAPSSHNCQPWKFAVTDKAIYVIPESARALPVSDASERHLYIALGCALENICIAADYYGLANVVEYFPAEKKEAAVKISFEKPTPRETGDDTHLIFSIVRRRSNRNPYTDRMPDKTFLDHFQDLSSDGVRVDIISDKARKDAITDILVSFRENIFSDARFRGELADYKRTNLTRSFFGMPGFTMGFNMFLSFIAPFLIRHFNVIKLTRTKEMALLKERTPVFVVVSAKGNTKQDRLNAGRAIERIALEAERSGIQTAISAVPPETGELRKVLGTSYFPQIFSRLGYTEDVPGHSPRISASEILEHSAA